MKVLNPAYTPYAVAALAELRIYRIFKNSNVDNFC